MTWPRAQYRIEINIINVDNISTLRAKTRPVLFSSVSPILVLAKNIKEWIDILSYPPTIHKSIRALNTSAFSTQERGKKAWALGLLYPFKRCEMVGRTNGGQEVSEKKVNGARPTLRKVWTLTLLLPFLREGFFFHSKVLWSEIQVWV